MIRSMTGYASTRLEWAGESYQIEMKSLNHRFLDLKLRMPRDFIRFEPEIRARIEAKIKRGALDVWIERQGQSKSESAFHYSEERARMAFGVLNRIRDQFQIREEVRLQDLVSFPEVISKNPPAGDSGVSGGSATLEVSPEMKAALEGALSAALQSLVEMKLAEGARLKTALLAMVLSLKEAHARLLTQRDLIRTRAREKTQKRIEQCFDAYPTGDEKLRALIETRVAQEISYILEKLDVEEELTRFIGHVHAIEQELSGQRDQGVGKRLDFLFQELNREINTLGNKSQDLEISKEVIELKMKVEQMREQSLNLE